MKYFQKRRVRYADRTNSSSKKMVRTADPTGLFFLQLFLFSLLMLQFLASYSVATEPQKSKPAADEGYRILREYPFLIPDFDEEVLDELWTLWPEKLKTKAENSTPTERRQMIFEMYGIKPLPEDSDSYAKALGYVQRSAGEWTMNCLACHGGEIDGRVIPGIGNTDFDLQSLAEDVRIIKQEQGKSLTHLDGSVDKTLLSSGPGLTAAVNFGVDLGALRDRDMNVIWSAKKPVRPDYGVDAPPFWNTKYKQRLYCDNHAPNYHRVLMQFILHPWNNASFVKRNEDKFRHIQAWIQSVEAPQYPFAIERRLAARGQVLFNQTCAECHGTYEGELVDYPERVIRLDQIGTDPVRLQSLTPEFHRKLAESWLTKKDDGSDEHLPVVIAPVGYLAPPLKGIWASAPYFHNGSVPTLWHVLHPAERPRIWKRSSRDYDQDNAGHAVEVFQQLPDDYGSLSKYEQRRIYNHDDFGKRVDGHDFPNVLTEKERRAVLEYLKSL